MEEIEYICVGDGKEEGMGWRRWNTYAWGMGRRRGWDGGDRIHMRGGWEGGGDGMEEIEYICVGGGKEEVE